MTILAEVKALGQQIWLDNLSRSLLENGTLARLLADGVCGVTSNPAIFQKAFAGDELYRADIARLKEQGLAPAQIYETLAVADVQAACDICLGEFQRSGGNSGWVSLEVAPELAHNAAGTIGEARRLHTLLARPNAMIKIPATDAGIQAFETLTAEGISVNLTLLFSRAQTLKAYAAYSRGIAKRAAAGQLVGAVRAVASFFISRVDAALDGKLPENLRGKTAIALAKAAYLDWQNHVAGAEFQAAAAAGAAPVSLLWASTGVKNPAYPDTLYVDSLIGENTVNTVPDATLAAFIDHGSARPTLTENQEQALADLAAAEAAGAELETLARQLQVVGLQQFKQAFDQLLAALG